MGKGDRRGKTKPAGIPSLAPIKPGRANPRDRRGTNKPDDAPRVALASRIHHFSDAPATKDERDRARAQHMGCHIGWIMQREMPKEVPRLWRTWQAWCQAEETYMVRIIGAVAHPKGASIAVIPEKIETDTGHSVDLRTADERDRDAVKAWMRWRGYLGHLTSREIEALHQARREDGPCIWRNRKPTKHGLFTLAALDRLSVVVDS